jgi:hypothetical protein
MLLIIPTISLIVTMASIEQKANAAPSTITNINTNTINCQSKKGGTNTAVFGTLKHAGESVQVKMVELLQQVESNLTQVLLARTVLRYITAIPVCKYEEF